MPESSTEPTVMCADRLERGGKRPVLAIAAFCGAFLFVAPALVFDTDNFLIVAPCVIGSFCLASVHPIGHRPTGAREVVFAASSVELPPGDNGISLPCSAPVC
jgi:hypothetical protein